MKNKNNNNDKPANAWPPSEGHFVKSIANLINDSLFAPFVKKLNNFNFGGYARLLNNPRQQVGKALEENLNLEQMGMVKIVRAIRESGSEPVEKILDDYLDRMDSIEWAISSLIGRKLPIVEAISADLHQILQKTNEPSTLPSAIITLLDEVSNIFKTLLVELKLIAKKNEHHHWGKLKYGYFYDWVNCNTEIDKKHQDLSTEDRKSQQRLRYTMMKVILSYVEDVDVSPDRFRSVATDVLSNEPETYPAQAPIPLSSYSGQSSAMLGKALMRPYAGLIAAAFEHIFISGEQGLSSLDEVLTDLYRELPLTLKLQKPELFKSSMKTKGNLVFNDIDLEIDSELMAIKLATMNARYTSDLVQTAIVCIGNGIWEVSPNNPPLVETIASFVSVLVYELEKAITYDLLRRFRVYVSDKPIIKSSDNTLMIASIKVPDFSDNEATEKTMTAIISLTQNDEALLGGLRKILGQLPVKLDSDHLPGRESEIARLLEGMLKDAVAISAIAVS